MKKIFAFLLVAVMAASLLGVASAEGFYAGKTVEVIVPWGAGGGADTACRLVCQYVEKELGCTCVINNITGGGGSIGLNQLLALLGIKGPLWLTEFNGFIPLPMWVIGFVALWQYVGQNMMLYMAQIMGINKSIYEASYVDGATKWQSFRAITLPLIKPMLVTAMSLNCIGSLKFFDLVYNLTQGGPNHVTENIATWIYYNGVQLSDKRGYACAISMVLLVLCLLTTFLVNKVIKPEHYEM